MGTKGGLYFLYPAIIYLITLFAAIVIKLIINKMAKKEKPVKDGLWRCPKDEGPSQQELMNQVSVPEEKTKDSASPVKESLLEPGGITFQKSSSWTKEQWGKVDKLLDDVIEIIESRDKTRIENNREKAMEIASKVLKALEGDSLAYAVSMRTKCNRIIIAFSSTSKPEDLPTGEVGENLKELHKLIQSPSATREQVITQLKSTIRLIPDNNFSDLGVTMARELGAHLLNFENARGEKEMEGAVKFLRGTLIKLLGLLGLEIPPEPSAKEPPANEVSTLEPDAKDQIERFREALEKIFRSSAPLGQRREQIYAIRDSFTNDKTDKAKPAINLCKEYVVKIGEAIANVDEMTMIICPECGEVICGDSAFCTECGGIWDCSNMKCHEVISVDQEKCERCGTHVNVLITDEEYCLIEQWVSNTIEIINEFGVAGFVNKDIAWERVASIYNRLMNDSSGRDFVLICEKCIDILRIFGPPAPDAETPSGQIKSSASIANEAAAALTQPPTPAAEPEPTTIPAPVKVLQILWKQLTKKQQEIATTLFDFTKGSWNHGPVPEAWTKIWAIPFGSLPLDYQKAVFSFGFTADNWGKTPSEEAPNS